eukprot:gene8033-10064_t
MSYATAATRSNSQQSSQHDRPESRRDPSQEQQKDKQKPVSQTDQDFHLVQSRAHHTKQESVLEQQPHELDHEGNEIKPLGCLKPDAAEFIPSEEDTATMQNEHHYQPQSSFVSSIANTQAVSMATQHFTMAPSHIPPSTPQLSYTPMSRFANSYPVHQNQFYTKYVSVT